MKHRHGGGPQDERAPGGPVVGVLERRGRFLTAEPFFHRGRRMNVERPRPGSAARPGDLVLVAPNGPRSGHARILRRIGSPDVARDVIEAMLLDRGLRRRFDPHVEREARAAAEAPPSEQADGRLDLRALPTFTIDPPTARDFDDAISAEALEGGAVRVWVHIADVSHYVKPGSPVDREAFRRATSVYVPGTVHAHPAPAEEERLRGQEASAPLQHGDDRARDGPLVRPSAHSDFSAAVLTAVRSASSAFVFGLYSDLMSGVMPLPCLTPAPPMLRPLGRKYWPTVMSSAPPFSSGMIC